MAQPTQTDGSLRMARSGATTNISWTDAPGPYNVYRGHNGPGTPWLYDQTCLSHETPTASASDPDVPPLHTLFYYLVSRVNLCRESILGTDSNGAPVPNDNPCPAPPTDTDGDGVPDVADNCPIDPNAGQLDVDGDSHGDVCDNCPTDSNPDQFDADDDGIGNVCDPVFTADGAFQRAQRPTEGSIAP